MTDETNKKVPVLAGTPIRAIVPDSLDSAFRLAQAFVRGGVAPRGMKEPEQVMIAILAGLEVGLSPLQAVQGIWVSNGRPSLYGDTLVAVVRGSGKCKYIKTWIEGSGDSVTAWAETWREGEPEPQRQSYSWAMAKRAGLTGKEGPWQTAPARMLTFRAKNFLLRDVYADVLRGLGGDETIDPVEVGPLDTEPQPGRGSPPDPDMPEDKIVDAESEPIDDKPSADGPPDPGEEEENAAAQQLLAAFRNGLKLVKKPADITELWNDLEIESSLDEDDLAMANTLKDRAMKRLAKEKK